MDALILAAGMGSRIKNVSPCKPLTQLYDLSLLEITIRQLDSAGAKRIVVAVGYRAGDIEAALPAIEKRTGVSIETRRVNDYRQPNGYSVLSGAADFGGNFLLVMADHIFSSTLLRKVAEEASSSDGAVLAIDRRMNSPLIDPEDATWVATDNSGKILRIGKNIHDYDAVDCGAFLATSALPEAIRAAIADGMPGSLSDGMQRLAGNGAASTIDIGEEWWIDVDDARSLELAKSQIKAHLPELFDRRLR